MAVLVLSSYDDFGESDDLELESDLLASSPDLYDDDEVLEEALDVVLAANPALAKNLDRLVEAVVDEAEFLEDAREWERRDHKRTHLTTLIDAYETRQRALWAQGEDLEPAELKRLRQLRLS